MAKSSSLNSLVLKRDTCSDRGDNGIRAGGTDMDTPEFLMCVECDSPVYVFEWDGIRVTEAMCTACGNDKPILFSTEEDYGEMMAADERPTDSNES